MVWNFQLWVIVRQNLREDSEVVKNYDESKYRVQTSSFHNEKKMIKKREMIKIIRSLLKKNCAGTSDYTGMSAGKC